MVSLPRTTTGTCNILVWVSARHRQDHWHSGAHGTDNVLPVCGLENVESIFKMLHFTSAWYFHNFVSFKKKNHYYLLLFQDWCFLLHLKANFPQIMAQAISQGVLLPLHHSSDMPGSFSADGSIQAIVKQHGFHILIGSAHENGWQFSTTYHSHMLPNLHCCSLLFREPRTVQLCIRCTWECVLSNFQLKISYV